MAAFVVQDLCRGCGVCVQVCAYRAISIQAHLARVDPLACRDCEECIFTCPNGAITQKEEPKESA
ncbi:MAG: 4Fe-4S dicluster domain-containing protein [Bacillota bacterium]